MFASIGPSAAEVDAPRPGDDLVAGAEVVMDRAFTVAAPPKSVWPWIQQLGKRRAGWYLPRRLERMLPTGRRGWRVVNPDWQLLEVGDVIPDYGGRDETFEVAQIAEPDALVYRSRRGSAEVSWSITLHPAAGGTRLHFRLRLGPVKHRWLAEYGGGLIDALTIAGLAAGLRERLRDR